MSKSLSSAMVVICCLGESDIDFVSFDKLVVSGGK